MSEVLQSAGLRFGVTLEMEFEEAVDLINQALATHSGRSLTDVEEILFRGAWQGQTYEVTAENSGYSPSYLTRMVGPKFWKELSQALGEPVSKTSFRATLERLWRRSQQASATASIVNHAPATQALALGAIAQTPASLSAMGEPEIYIERPPLETLCHDTLLQPGALVRVKSPSLMGKTLMMDRVLTQLAAENQRTVRLSMKMADRKAHFSDLNRFLRWMCINVSRTLGLPHQIDDYWDEEGMGSKVSCSTYIEEYLLTASDAPLVLCLDDVDLLFSYPDIYEDFFGLLRSWYELARTRTCPIWKQLRLAIVHSTDVYIPLNINQSPFNVGVPIELIDFNCEQAEEFAHQHQLSDLDTKQLMDMVGGHPYLLQQAFDHLKGHPDQGLPQLLANAPTDSGIYASHLRECWLGIRDHPQLQKILTTVMTAEQPVALDSILAHQLHSMGVIQLQGNLAQPRCQLYRQYFQARLES